MQTMNIVEAPVTALVKAIRAITRLDVEDVGFLVGMPVEVIEAAMRREAMGLEPISRIVGELTDQLAVAWLGVANADIPDGAQDRRQWASWAKFEVEHAGFVPQLAGVLGWQGLADSTGISLEGLLALADSPFRQLRTVQEWGAILGAVLEAVAGWEDDGMLRWDLDETAPWMWPGSFGAGRAGAFGAVGA